MPYGFVNMITKEGNVNPCFFLQFETEEFWNPKALKQTKDGNDQFLLDSVAEIQSNIDLFSEMIEISNEKNYTSFAFPSPAQSEVKEWLEYFLENKNVVEHFVGLGESIDIFVNIERELNPIYIDGLKMIKKLKNDSTELFNYEDKYKRAKFDRLHEKHLDSLDYWRICAFGGAVRFLRTLDSVEERAAVDLYQELTQLESYNKPDLLDTCIKVLGK